MTCKLIVLWVLSRQAKIFSRIRMSSMSANERHLRALRANESIAKLTISITSGVSLCDRFVIKIW